MSEPTALIVVDMQPDFLPGGRLAVQQGDQVLDGIADLLRSDDFAVKVATQDWHPPDHVSFASNHPGRGPMDTIELHGHQQVLWPDHCVQDTPGAALVDGLPWHEVDAIIRKGMNPSVDSYSGFRNNWGPEGARPSTGLAGYLSDRGVSAVLVCGLARDFCVRWTAEDAAQVGFATTLRWDLSRSVDPSGDGRMRQELEESGIRIKGA
jgi:nicotinamidase/pyrazinamidase